MVVSVATASQLVTIVYFGKMADSIEMPCEVLGRVGRRNDVLDGRGKFVEEMRWHIVTCRRCDLFPN